mmetsp:Transcript_32786/g.98688  ORF Transcript_32786/g.98688 Transcript_32786/m.98688 type:complete len:239 (-) Transcript_32786:167-883(-)
MRPCETLGDGVKRLELLPGPRFGIRRRVGRKRLRAVDHGPDRVLPVALVANVRVGRAERVPLGRRAKEHEGLRRVADAIHVGEEPAEAVFELGDVVEVRASINHNNICGARLVAEPLRALPLRPAAVQCAVAQIVRTHKADLRRRVPALGNDARHVCLLSDSDAVADVEDLWDRGGAAADVAPELLEDPAGERLVRFQFARRGNVVHVCVGAFGFAPRRAPRDALVREKRIPVERLDH